MNLKDYDIIIINSSGGKDSLCAIWKVCQIAKDQSYPLEQVIISHQDLGEAEWQGTKDLVRLQADQFGLKTYFSKRRNKNGEEESLLQYVKRRGKWPSNKQRYCTSDFKRGPGARIVTMLTKEMGECKVLYVFGFRRDESPSRSKKVGLAINKRLSTNRRSVFDWLPIHDWSTEQVWATIRENNLPYHPAYDLGMPRLSCCFCIFSPMNALIVAGRANPALLDRYIEVEQLIGHTFRSGFSLKQVKDAIESDYKIESIQNWVM
jgi:3'-phosphoadenosine 5'-phosphosulfate sulfotransferase (PAPS reductase)/FAD synthetase